VINAAARGDVAKALNAADEMIRRGSSVRTILEAIAQRVRDLLYARVGALDESLPVGDLAALKAQAQHFTPDALSRMLDILVRAQAQLRNVPQQRILLDMAMVQIASAKNEKAESEPARKAQPTATIPPSEPAPVEEKRQPPVPTPAPSPATQPAESEPAPKPVDSTTATQTDADALALLKLVQGRWDQIIARVAERSRGGAEVLRNATPVRIEGENVIVLRFQSEFLYAQIQSEKRRQFVEQTISRMLGGKPVSLRCELHRANASQTESKNTQDNEPMDGEEYAQEVAQTFNGYIEIEGG
jgi:DNA polymerase III gamma/tau subunit